MQLKFQITKAFERDLKRFTTQDQERIAHRIQLLGDTFRSDRSLFLSYVSRPMSIRLGHGLESSLWQAKVTPDIRLVLTAEDDPLFDEVTITLLGVFRKQHLIGEFEKIARRLYSDSGLPLESLEPRNDESD
jgi:mRNA-degrading endonuclease YafQ of YafQ-DinJ toxin-antitoxin module